MTMVKANDDLIGHIEFEVEDRLSKYSDKERCEFIGRLVDMLVTKSIITHAEAGNLFYEEWARP